MAHTSGPIKKILEEIEEEINDQKLYIQLQQNRISEVRFQNLNKKAKQHILKILYERLETQINKLQKLKSKKIIISCG